MFEDLKGKKVLITGSSSGIGAKIAELFASYGSDIGIHYKSNKENAVKLARELSEYSVKTELFEGNLGDVNFRNNLICDFVSRFGKIDILVNNAGACYNYKHFLDLDEESWDKTFAINTKAPFILSREAFKYMKDNNWGRIINISSVSIKYGGVFSMHYYASKAAMEAFTTGLVKEGSKYNILVNNIRCGMIDTPMHKGIDGYNEKNFKNRVDKILLKRIGMPIDIARMVIFLASECGDFITGETYAISGGD